MNLIEDEKLKELRELSGGNDDLLKTLLDKYITNSDNFITQIREAIKNDDKEKIQFIVHTLKGSSLSLGLVEIGKIFSDLNTRAKKGDYENFSEKINSVETLMKDVSEYRNNL